MMNFRFNQAKCETTSRLCVGRIKLIRNKKNVLMKESRKGIAELLQKGRQEHARIRVEGVIREKLLMQAYEILELYLELLTIRTQMIAKTKELPRDLMEAVSSIIYASQRISDLPELANLRELFAGKYGKEYTADAAADATANRWQVNGKLIKCLLVEAPSPEDKLEMLSEIAQEYGVEWDMATAAREMGVGMGTAAREEAADLLPPHQTICNANVAAAIAAPLPMAGTPAASPYPVIAPLQGPMAPVPVHTVACAVQYTNAQEAAIAAAQAAAQASAAAQYAAQVAAATAHQQPGAARAFIGNGNGTVIGQQQVGGTQFGLPPTLTQAAAAAVAPAGIGRPIPSPPPYSDAPPPDDEEAASAMPSAPPPPSSSGGGASTVSSTGGYFVRSESAIQRAYDAAQGPPSKGTSAAAAAPPPVVAPPSSPPPLSEKHLPSSAPSLPPPPPPPSGAEDEYEELTRRLEALKRS